MAKKADPQDCVGTVCKIGVGLRSGATANEAQKKEGDA